MYKRPTLRPSFLTRGGPAPVTYLPDYLRCKPDGAAMWSYTFRPIKDWEGYLNCQRLNGASEEELKRLEALHKRNWPIPVLNETPKPKYPTQSVICKTKVEGDRVRVKIQENKFATMLKNMAMGKKIPQKTWIEAWMFAGRPYKEILEGLVKLKASKNDPFPLLEVTKEPVAKKILVPVKKCLT